MASRVARSMMMQLVQLKRAFAAANRFLDSRRSDKISCGVGPSSRWRLQAVQIIRCALRMRCGGEDRALVVFQNLDP
jgi:hypothetical protein